jgi:hypothetical protein
MKGVWMGWIIISHLIIQIVAFFGFGVVVAEAVDSTLVGLIAAILLYITGLINFIIAPLAFVFVGIPNIIFAQFGWITEEDLS